jgi:hypothetical protein
MYIRVPSCTCTIPTYENDHTKHYDNGRDLNITAILPGDVMSHDVRTVSRILACLLLLLVLFGSLNQLWL